MRRAAPSARGGGGDRQPRGRQRVELALAVVLFLLAAGMFAARVLPLLTFPHSLRYGEGVLLDQARRGFHEPGLYPPLGSPPHLIGNYPPVYPALCGLLPQLERAPFFTGRLLSTLSVLAASFIVVLILRRSWGDAVGLLGGAAFLSLPEVQEFGVLMRVDALGVALALLGLHLTVGGLEDGPGDGRGTRRSKLTLACGMAAFFFSVYTRHSLVGTPLAASVILVRREGVRSLVWPAGLLAAGIAAYLVGWWWSDGALYEHMIALNRLPFHFTAWIGKWFASMFPERYVLALLPLAALVPGRVVGHERSLLARGVFVALLGIGIGCALLPWIQTLLSDTGRIDQGAARVLAGFHATWLLLVLFALVGWTGLPSRDRTNRVPAMLLLCGAVSASMIGRVGADVNYLFEYYAFLCLGAGLALGRSGGRLRVVLLAALALFIVVSQVSYEGVRSSRARRLGEISRRDRIVRVLRQLDGPILSEDPSLPVLAGHPLEYQPFMFHQLAREGLWDVRGLVVAVRAQKYAAVVLSRDRLYAGYDRGPNGEAIPYFGPVTRNVNSLPKEVEEAVFAAYEPSDIQVAEMVTDLSMSIRRVFLPKKR